MFYVGVVHADIAIVVCADMFENSYLLFDNEIRNLNLSKSNTTLAHPRCQNWETYTLGYEQDTAYHRLLTHFFIEFEE